MNKFRTITIGLALITLSGAWFVFHANAQPKPDAPSPTTAAEQQYQRMLNEQADRFKRTEALLKAQEDFFERQLKAFTRFEKVLETWERQQQQYQKYLDTLPTK